MVAGGSGAVVTVRTTVVPGSVTVFWTVCGAVVPAVSPSPRARSACGEDAGEERAGEEEQQQRHASPAACRRDRGDRGDPCRPGRPAESVAQGVDEVGGGGEPVLGLLREAPSEDVVELPRQLRIRVRRRRDRRAHVRDRLRRRGLTLERTLAGQELERDDRKRIEVARGRGPLATRLLGRQVARGADDRPGLGERAEIGCARDSEVGDLDALVVVQQQVRRLDVAVDDPVGVRGVEGGRGLPEPLERHGPPAARRHARAGRRASRRGGTPSRCRDARRARRRRRS